MRHHTKYSRDGELGQPENNTWNHNGTGTVNYSWIGQSFNGTRNEQNRSDVIGEKVEPKNLGQPGNNIWNHNGNVNYSSIGQSSNGTKNEQNRPDNSKNEQNRWDNTKKGQNKLDVIREKVEPKSGNSSDNVDQQNKGRFNWKYGMPIDDLKAFISNNMIPLCIGFATVMFLILLTMSSAALVVTASLRNDSSSDKAWFESELSSTEIDIDLIRATIANIRSVMEKMEYERGIKEKELDDAAAALKAGAELHQDSLLALWKQSDKLKSDIGKMREDLQFSIDKNAGAITTVDAKIDAHINYAVKRIEIATTWPKSGSVFYRYFTDRVSQSDAKADCERRGGRLAASILRNPITVRNFLELGFIHRALQTSHPWIGYDDIKEEGKYVWSDGKSDSWRDPNILEWVEIDPNGGVPNDDEDCVLIKRAEGGVLMMDDDICTIKRPYICEVDFDEVSN